MPFEEAPPGMLGVETALAVVHTTLVEPGVADARAGARRALVATRPASPGLDATATADRSRPARPANLCVFDPRAAWVVDAHRLASRSVNSPWDGWKLTGKVRHTILAGIPTVRDGSLRMSCTTLEDAQRLVLADGTTFEGVAVGHRPDDGVAAGEVVFNTALSGYQEIVTDPSYAGQMITFTYPHIGNYGVNAERRPGRARRTAAASSCAISRAARRTGAPPTISTAFLERHEVAGIAGIDTRRLTRHIRHAGAMPGAFGVADRDALLAAAQADGGTDGKDLADARHHRRRPTSSGPDDAPFFVVAYDFGIKRSILDQLVAAGCQVEVVPASTPAADVLAREPDGVFLSNGPGDPAAVAGAAENVRGLLGKVPVFGICLGHQIMGLALGAAHVQAAVRSPRRQPSGAPPRDRPGRDHEPEPQLRDRSPTRCPTTAVVSHLNLNDGDVEGVRVPARSRVQRAVPPGSRARTARRPLSVRRVHRSDAEQV